MLQVFLTILGGIIAAGAGALVSFCQDKRRIRRRIRSLYLEVTHNIEKLDVALRKVENDNLRSFNTDYLDIVAYKSVVSEGDLSILSEKVLRNLFAAYDTIVEYQRKRLRAVEAPQLKEIIGKLQSQLKSAQDDLTKGKKWIKMRTKNGSG